MTGVIIRDVAPRDGLQNDAIVLAPEVRAELCRRIVAAGTPQVEACSFVRDDLVPAMAGAENLVGGLDRSPLEPWTALILNERGYDRGLAVGLRAMNVTIAVTNEFCERNQGCSRDDAEAMVRRLARRALEDGVRLTVTLAVAFGCPFRGRVTAAETLELAHRIVDWQPHEIVLADTIGVAVPTGVRAVMAEASTLGIPIGGHFHDTRNTGIANCLTAIEHGATTLDTSVGGIGGCPFAPGATGNVAAEDLVFVLDEMGVDTGVDLEGLLDCSRWLASQLGRPVPSAISQAGGFPLPAAAP